MANTLQDMVQKQVGEVLKRGQRFERFDQLRSRHFWSSYLFAPGAGNPVNAGQYDIFKLTPGQSGQGYPANVPLTLRETNWLNAGRVPDNQNFVITEIGAQIVPIPATSGIANPGTPPPAIVPIGTPQDGIFANLPPAILPFINAFSGVSPDDVYAMLMGTVLEMTFLTNSVPLGYLADFSQSAGEYAPDNFFSIIGGGFAGGILPAPYTSNGVPAAAFRRKLEVPILLQHGESMGMRLNIHRPIPTTPLGIGGTGIFEVRVDWWAHESFTEKS
jgi:hypothetical protein